MSNPSWTSVLDIRRVSLFEELTEAEAALVSDVAEFRHCPAETCVVEAGTVDRSLFVILSGSVRIVKLRDDGSATPIAEVLPGDSLGEVTFVEGGARTATAITNEATELLLLEPRRFRSLGEQHPAIAYKLAWALLRLVCRRMRNTDYWLFELMGQPRASVSA